MNDNNVNLDCGGFAAFLTLLFITLKLCGVISWSWWLIFAPLIVIYGLALIVILIMVIYFLIKMHTKG